MRLHVRPLEVEGRLFVATPELGFVPVAYLPALAFHEVERLDVVRMARLLVPLELGRIQLTPRMRVIADVVLSSLSDQQILPRIGPVVRRSGLFRGLTDEHVARLGGQRMLKRCDADEVEGLETFFDPWRQTLWETLEKLDVGLGKGPEAVILAP